MCLLSLVISKLRQAVSKDCMFVPARIIQYWSIIGRPTERKNSQNLLITMMMKSVVTEAGIKGREK